MLFDLFEEPALVAGTTPPHESDAAAAAVAMQANPEKARGEPEPAKAISIADSVAENYQAGLHAAIAAITDLTQPMRAFYGRGFNPFEEALRQLPCSNSLNKAMFALILKDAKQTGLAASGDYHFDADFSKYLAGLDRHGSWRGDATLKVDIRGLCNAIFNAYAGDAGDKIENKRVARALISLFDLENKAIKPKKGFVELTHYTYLEKRFNGDYNFSYSSAGPISNTLANLKHAFSHSDLIVDMMELQLALRDSFYKLEPNKTVFSGHIDDEPFTVKVFKGELRWKFTERCIAILSDFVAEYGSED